MTIRHLFFWSVEDDQKNGIYVLDELASLNGNVPGVSNWSIGRHVGQGLQGSGESFDYALTSDFESLEALRAYDEHPVHQAVLKRVFPLYSRWAVVDLEI